MSTLFPTSKQAHPKPKTHISIGHLPPYISPTQPPTKKSPWRQLKSTPFISSVTITTTSTMYTSSILPILTPNQSTPNHYAKLITTLHSLLTTRFFTTHIKTGNILLLSSGRPGTDDWHAHLTDGHLHLELSRDLYERCGLQGTPLPHGGGAQKHTRERWVVTTDLRSPASVPGRKGFERLLRAADRVLTDARVWLFRDLVGWTTDEERRAARQVVDVFHPTWVDLTVPTDVSDVKSVRVPEFVGRATDTTTTTPPLEVHEDFSDLVEWLDLVQLGSPRVREGDTPDPYISRYSVGDVEGVRGLKVVNWTGLLDREWCTRLLIEIVRLSRKAEADQWVAVTVNAHRTEALSNVDGCTILLQPGGHVDGEMGEGDADVDMQGTSEVASTAGLQRFTCFQFVDTVRT